MKKLLIACLIAAGIKPSYAGVEPYSIELQRIYIPGSPAIHSFAFAKSGGKWLFIGGRTNGLHGFNANNAFPKQFSNTRIFVVDPVTNQTWSRSIFDDLPVASADQFRSMNMQYAQIGNKLYYIGGYGYDSTKNTFITFPMLKIIDVEQTIQAVITGNSISPFVKELTDSRMQVCGGELQTIGDQLIMAGGHIFTGLYSETKNDQVYVNQIRKFKVLESTDEVSITDYSALTDTVEYHRRDMNLVPAIKPGGTEPYVILYGGVFKSYANLPFLNPIYIDNNGATTDYSFSQMMSQYTCAYMSAFDSNTGDMHTTLLGGTSLYAYYEAIDSLVYDSLVPFINDISTITRKADGSSVEVMSDTRFPVLIGTNAKFIIDDNIPQYPNGVINLSQLSGKTFAGYMFGGIRAMLPNNTPSFPSEYIYRIYITPKSVFVNQIGTGIPGSFTLNQNYPNPFNPQTRIRFALPQSSNVRLAVFDGLGREVAELLNERLQPGTFEIDWNAEGYTSGVYFYRLESSSFTETKKMLLIR